MLDTGLLEVKSRVHQHLADNKQAFDHVNKAIEYLCWTTLNGRRAERVEYIKKTMAVLEIRKELKGIMESKRRLYDRARQSLNFLGLQSRAAAQESDASMRMLREHGFMPHARHEVN
jgi:phage gp37-like protein